MSQRINDDQAQHHTASLALFEHRIDDFDHMFWHTLQNEVCAEPAYDKMWMHIRERIEHERQLQQSDARLALLWQSWREQIGVIHGCEGAYFLPLLRLAK